jgi:SAM-dependent methyltransferase
MPTVALLIGRFHALTRAQGELIGRLSADPEIARIVCVLTSADHAGTRRNPLDAETREAMLRPALEASGKPFVLVRVNDIHDDAGWVAHVARAVEAATGIGLAPGRTRLYSANRDVNALFAADGYELVALPHPQRTPHELVQAVVDGKPWLDEAAPSMREVYARPGLIERLRAIFDDRKRTDDGELATHREFDTYGAQMDASLKQKLDDLGPFVLPGLIVDKGCGTGKLMVELSRRFPDSAFVGVDLSREFLRRSDENTYFSENVELVQGDAAAQSVPDGSATTVIFSSIMHEIYTYSGYDQAQVERALDSAHRELARGGRILVRDGVSPGDAPWRLELLDDETRAAFARFAAEFKHGQGAPHERLSATMVRLSAHLANEFLCKKDYQRNWAIEVHEEYGARTVDGWRAALERHSFRVVHLSGCVNEWIAEHRYRGKVALSDDAGRALPWPATNVIAVGEKS